MTKAREASPLHASAHHGAFPCMRMLTTAPSLACRYERVPCLTKARSNDEAKEAWTNRTLWYAKRGYRGPPCCKACKKCCMDLEDGN